ncbi:MAG: YcxB family protein [Epulopiscium sp.]|nr:YcxB family protein [Candidatus Epulonipiscium sp.]
MKEDALFIITTKMEKEDYRKFLYTATFRRNPAVLWILAGISLLGTIFLQFSVGQIRILPLLLKWCLLMVIAVVVICFQVERKNKTRIRTDKTGTFEQETVLYFYPQHLKTEVPAVKGTHTLEYHQFFQVLESKDYFMFYYSKNLASLLRKKDMEELDSFREFLKEKFGARYRILR